MSHLKKTHADDATCGSSAPPEWAAAAGLEAIALASLLRHIGQGRTHRAATVLAGCYIAEFADEQHSARR
jgi:hypothetical protein